MICCSSLTNQSGWDVAIAPLSPENRSMPSIPVMRPKLPSTERLAPYLQSIDASRVYSNYGPLTLSLEDRLAAHYRLSQGTVGTVANATVGLAIALAIQHPPPGTLCVMPRSE